METETKNVGPELPCPQCRASMPADGRYCLACGAEMHAACPDCGTRRGADNAFCRKCGFNFSLRKLRLKDQPPAAASTPHAPAGNPLPRVGFHKPGKRYEYRMNPRMGLIRAFFVLIFLLLIAAVVFVVFNVIWGNLSVKDIREWYGSVFSAVTERVAVAEKKPDPDWKVRTFLDVKCPACAGLGYLVEAGGVQRDAGGLSSGKGIGRTGGVALQQGTPVRPAMARTGKQTCPVCGGKGLRRFERVPDFPWPAGATRCGSCQGMGKVLTKSEQGLNQGIKCSICDGRGFAVNQYDAVRNVPPKYE